MITSAILGTQVFDCCTHPLEVTDNNLESLTHTEALHLSGSSIRVLFSMTIGKSYLCELMVFYATTMRAALLCMCKSVQALGIAIPVSFVESISPNLFQGPLPVVSSCFDLKSRSY